MWKKSIFNGRGVEKTYTPSEGEHVSRGSCEAIIRNKIRGKTDRTSFRGMRRKKKAVLFF